MRPWNPLRKYRKAKKLNQQQVAALLGLKNSSLISRWENGFSLPDLENAFRLAVIYGVMVDALFIELRREIQRKYSQAKATPSPSTPNVVESGA